MGGENRPQRLAQRVEGCEFFANFASVSSGFMDDDTWEGEFGSGGSGEGFETALTGRLGVARPANLSDRSRIHGNHDQNLTRFEFQSPTSHCSARARISIVLLANRQHTQHNAEQQQPTKTEKLRSEENMNALSSGNRHWKEPTDEEQKTERMTQNRTESSSPGGFSAR